MTATTTTIGAVSLPASDGAIAPADAGTWTVTATGGRTSIEFRFPPGPAFVLDGDAELFVLPSDATGRTLSGSGACWMLPVDAFAADGAWHLEADGAITATPGDTAWTVAVGAASARLTHHRARPHADVTGGRFALDLPGGELLADAAAGFYWGTMLPSVIERTTAAEYPDPIGYVRSTMAGMYAGTYPDVDHEFQIKGRLAWGGDLDRDVVRRMIELQLRLMREDPTGLWRDPCAVQPNGDREYHVRRGSMDGTENAVMFLVTGNIEVLESIWLFVARTADLDWLRRSIADIEGAASGIELHIDVLGRLWGDVYYEDQVIKDGRETMAQALAVRSFDLLAQLEDLLGRDAQAARYRSLSDALAASLTQPLPHGWWDADTRHFVDWVDRSGRPHDHIHLLANILPVLVGAADDAQQQAVLELVERELPEFQRFPTFLSARIADYTDAEIGDGGPYDLCAAGRYWCWDAAFWASRGDGSMLRRQLEQVAREGERDAWIMGERYDMGHVYYVDGTSWHGAEHYYEYPCVYAWVLFHEYLGLRPALDADLLIAPRIAEHGEVTLAQSAYRVRYRYAADGFTVWNLADDERSIRIDASALFPGVRVALDGEEYDGAALVLAPGAHVVLTPS
ncbi:hypothetical protein JOD63_000030 [Microbacterium terrae]|uniref:Uncharacterized protein n=1 Tax=Microbacterium terrae TaxID=69369 RepID=A0A0M2H2Y5_9MICO|nr:hypothetical protein [Microbacterium terrae]KJL38643.1 hypothetical protein RS81_02438 [Microbacterium terrae]MBP1076062.1 hypothetical protein [Microbacterium terrae]GLJ96882.1 hypothetical protein GCM10017594_00790 [Microbacterium terrae]